MTTVLTQEDLSRMQEKIPPSDPAMTEAIFQEYIKEGYIIYDGKRNKAVCTRCGEEWDIYPGEYARMHGLQEECPCCSSVGILLSAGRGREKFTEYHRVLSFAEAEGTMYAFLNSIIVKFRPFGRPELFRSCDELYIINKDEQNRYQRHWNYYTREWEYWRINNLKVPAAPHAPFTWESMWKEHAYTYGLREMLAESSCRYVLGANSLPDVNEMDLPTYIGMMMKYHSVELLMKAGFSEIVKRKIAGLGCRAINWRGKSLEKILKLPKGDVRKIREWNPTYRDLEIYQNLAPEHRRIIDWPLFRDICGFESYDHQTKKYSSRYIENVEQYMPFDKWVRWAKTQENYREAKEPHLLRDYQDYIRTATVLGMDIHKKSVQRPKDLQRAHDDVVSRWKVSRNSLIDTAIKENARAAEFSAIGLTIRAATCQEDLNKESARLCHCVKTYGDKLARGHCLIFFIRREGEPDVPYYTLETRPDGTFVQCRGLHNSNMTEDVRLFKDAFVKKLQAEIKKERKTACQTA